MGKQAVHTAGTQPRRVRRLRHGSASASISRKRPDPATLREPLASLYMIGAYFWKKYTARSFFTGWPVGRTLQAECDLTRESPHTSGLGRGRLPLNAGVRENKYHVHVHVLVGGDSHCSNLAYFIPSLKNKAQ